MKNRKADLVTDTLERLDALFVKAQDDLRESEYELRAWNIELARFLDYFDSGSDYDVDYGSMNEEEKTLLRVVEAKVKEWRAKEDNTRKSFNKIVELVERAKKAQRSFAVFDGTQYLTNRLNSGSSVELRDPDTEIHRIRKTVYEIEAYQEILG